MPKSALRTRPRPVAGTEEKESSNEKEPDPPALEMMSIGSESRGANFGFANRERQQPGRARLAAYVGRHAGLLPAGTGTTN